MVSVKMIGVMVGGDLARLTASNVSETKTFQTESYCLLPLTLFPQVDGIRM